MPRPGRPRTTAPDTTRIKKAYHFDDHQAADLTAHVSGRYPNLPPDKRDPLIADLIEAARAFSGGFVPLPAVGRSSSMTSKVLVHECAEALTRATGSGAIWARAAADGGGESESVLLARRIIEIVTGKPCPYDLRRIVQGARGVQIEG